MRKIVDQDGDFRVLGNLFELFRVPSRTEDYRFLLSHIGEVHETEVRLSVGLSGQKAKPRCPT